MDLRALSISTRMFLDMPVRRALRVVIPLRMHSVGTSRILIAISHKLVMGGRISWRNTWVSERKNQTCALPLVMAKRSPGFPVTSGF